VHTVPSCRLTEQECEIGGASNDRPFTRQGAVHGGQLELCSVAKASGEILPFVDETLFPAINERKKHTKAKRKIFIFTSYGFFADFSVNQY
jgi:hypothetical protein